MNSKILVSGFVVSALLLAGCSARKDKKSEEFPDEFAQGLEYAEKNRVDYVEMDDSGEDFTFKDEDASGLIASADRKNPIQDDAAGVMPNSMDKQKSIWDSTDGASELAPDPFSGLESIDENDFDSPSAAPVIGGAPIGGSAVPPQGDSTAPFSGMTDASGGTVAPAPNSASVEKSASPLQFNSPPPMIADARSASGDIAPPFRSPGSLSLETNTPNAAPAAALELRNPLIETNSSPIGTDSAAGALSTSGNGGSRAAQAIGASALGGGTAAGGTMSLEGLRPDPMPETESSPGSTAMQAGRSTANLPDARTLKQQGIDQYKDREFAAAVTSFRDYLSAYTEEEEAVRAWLGYALMQDRRYGEASKEFNTLLNSGNPELRADAHYYLGLIHEKQGDFEAARVRWEQVVETYPNSQAAEKARKSLGQSSP